MDPDIVFAIPSFQRPTKLKKQTLSWLLETVLYPQQIYVFVANAQEFEIYSQVLHHEVSLGLRIILGVEGLGRQLQFIQDWFREGQKIIRIDDDIRRIDWLNPRSFLQFVNRMFQIAEEEGCSLWSIYPVSNKFFCKDRIIIGKVFCIGCVCGFINHKETQRPHVSEAEDKWFSLQRYLKDGKTMRYEGCCPNTTFWSKGGLSEHRKLKQKEDTAWVCDQFPGLCELKQKKNGHWECFWKTTIQKVRQI